ncbi:molybdate transport system ATP-binding protein [Marinospirillum celere]|uniref:Molybdate transport system ATP-binding protein n=1 Tax=Marinospirillum celere TaxID=1122252 RepID=A0A1I1JS65_9GAMM|nr:ABC transporter ATP-binding protein [Marinospirillum celere]SFC51404.1 molybdate transport system ATP-binding protein [Marinospirillum celere]
MSEHLDLRFQLKAQGDIPLDVELHCQPGELLALLGPSGSGKTTLLRSLAGLYTQVKGEIYSGDSCWQSTDSGIQLAPEKRQLGMVFQSYALFPHLTALDNLLIPLQGLPKKQATQLARQWLERVHLKGLERRKPSELSGGQRQRVALARALIARPRALLLDEPFSAVDQATRQKLRRELALLRQEIAVPTLLVTHDLEEALQLADRICVLHRGQLLQVAQPECLMQRPASPTVARLLGMQNLFTGQILGNSQEEGLRLDWQGQQLTLPFKEGFTTGQEVTWMAPPHSLIMHRPDRPVTGDRENPIKGKIEELITLGPHASLAIRPQHAPQWPLRFYVPQHFVQRQQLAQGMQVSLSLMGKGLHLFQ